MRFMLSILSLTLLVGCYMPPRPLPDWKAAQMARNGKIPCGTWTKGQSLADGKRVIRVGRGYVTIRLRTGETINISCKP